MNIYDKEPLLSYQGDDLVIRIPNARGRNVDELILAGRTRAAVSTYTEPLQPDLVRPVADGLAEPHLESLGVDPSLQKKAVSVPIGPTEPMDNDTHRIAFAVDLERKLRSLFLGNRGHEITGVTVQWIDRPSFTNDEQVRFQYAAPEDHAFRIVATRRKLLPCCLAPPAQPSMDVAKNRQKRSTGFLARLLRQDPKVPTPGL